MIEELAAEPERRKKVVIIHTGGTIFMRETGRGREVGEVVLPRDSEGNISDHIDYSVIDLFGGGGIDSSKMTLKHSRKLAEKIVELQNDDSVDGIVVTHGTDTMAETAMELSYALKNLKKAVVLTGAQIPVSEKHSDGPRNLFRSIYLAAHAPHLKKVVICFGYRKGYQAKTPPNVAEVLKPTGKMPPNLVIDARNAEKSSIARQDAFLHPDSRVLGHVSVKGGVNVKANVPQPTGPTHLDFKFSTWARRKTVERHSTKVPIFATALTVEGYGAGNLPDTVLNALRRRVRFFPIVVASQARGKVDLTAYAAGRPALEAGVLPSGGLSPVTASKRMAYLTAHRGEIRRFARANRVDARKLLTTLFLSDGEFSSKEIKQKHAEALGLPILPGDLLVQIPFQRALKTAAREIHRFNKPPISPTETPKRRRTFMGLVRSVGQSVRRLWHES